MKNPYYFSFIFVEKQRYQHVVIPTVSRLRFDRIPLTMEHDS